MTHVYILYLQSVGVLVNQCSTPMIAVLDLVTYVSFLLQDCTSPWRTSMSEENEFLRMQVFKNCLYLLLPNSLPFYNMIS